MDQAIDIADILKKTAHMAAIIIYYQSIQCRGDSRTTRSKFSKVSRVAFAHCDGHYTPFGNRAKEAGICIFIKMIKIRHISSGKVADATVFPVAERKPDLVFGIQRN